MSDEKTARCLSLNWHFSQSTRQQFLTWNQCIHNGTKTKMYLTLLPKISYLRIYDVECVLTTEGRCLKSTLGPVHTQRRLKYRVNTSMMPGIQWSQSRIGCNPIPEWLYLFPLFSMIPKSPASSQEHWLCAGADTWYKRDLSICRRTRN